MDIPSPAPSRILPFGRRNFSLYEETRLKDSPVLPSGNVSSEAPSQLECFMVANCGSARETSVWWEYFSECSIYKWNHCVQNGKLHHFQLHVPNELYVILYSDQNKNNVLSRFTYFNLAAFYELPFMYRCAHLLLSLRYYVSQIQIMTCIFANYVSCQTHSGQAKK